MDNVILLQKPSVPPTPFRDLRVCMDLRSKYIEASLQRPGDNPKDRDPTDRHLAISEEITEKRAQMSHSELINHYARHLVKQLRDSETLDYPANSFNLEGGVYKVNYSDCDAPEIPSIQDYYTDLYRVIAINGEALTKTVVRLRLKYLADKFDAYLSGAELEELKDIKSSYRDFYTIYKVDTHVHHTACMSQHRLRDFINNQIRLLSDVHHEWANDDERDAVKDALKTLDLKLRDSAHVSINVMDMLAYRDSFHRFDNFNKKYSPAGQKKLKELFLKHDNPFGGRYLGELTQGVIEDLPAYECCEWRISVGGESFDDWEKLAKWISKYKLAHNRVRWLIQVPRRPHAGKTFQDIVKNIFEPLFLATKDPSSHKELHLFLQHVVGFDSVDDESKVEHRIGKTPPPPEAWNMEHVPPYSYWAYYMYANIAILNHWRKKRGFNTFVFRPHSGEAGDPEHIAAAFLTAQGISHGITLRDSPVLQYLYYLEQIGIAMSPISNNALFLEYEKNPLPNFFKVGLNVSLSTDDPLLFHFTHDPLLEEYSIATHIFKFSQASLAELARNSVVQSGFEMRFKNDWLGEDWQNTNHMIHHTNVPNGRLQHRRNTLDEEKEYMATKCVAEAAAAAAAAAAEAEAAAAAEAEAAAAAEAEVAAAAEA